MQLPDRPAAHWRSCSRETLLKTQFLSNISHDLRTPLTAIITHGEILRDGLLGALSDRQGDSVSTGSSAVDGNCWKW